MLFKKLQAKNLKKDAKKENFAQIFPPVT